MGFQADNAENVLLKRILYTVCVLLVFRLGVHIPVPGVNTKALVELAAGQGAGVLKLLNTFSGGALNNFSIFALGIFPYISASIMIQILTVVVPALEQLQKEGGVGRQKIQRITRIVALFVAIIQGYALAGSFMGQTTAGAGDIVIDKSATFQLFAALMMAAGTCFVMWLGEQITEKGIGNGSSLIIFAGIVAYFPRNLGSIITGLQSGTLTNFTIIGVVIFALLMTFGVVFIEMSYRKVPIHYARRSLARQAVSVQASYMPLKVNMSGVMPAIFASTLLSIPFTINQNFASTPWTMPFAVNQWGYNVLFALLIVAFCFFYTFIVFKPDDVAENLKRQSAYIPGIRPGKETSEALNAVVMRLTLLGAIYMNLVCLVPVASFRHFTDLQFVLGGTSLLIVVGVGLDIVRQVSAHMAIQRYDKINFFGSKEDNL